MFDAARVMLTIGRLGRTRGRLEYYDAQVAAGAEDYYAGRGDSPGRWRGGGVPALGWLREIESTRPRSWR